MSGIRGKDTKPELIVRKALFSAGYRYRLHRKDLPGAPDLAMPGRKLAIFVHGCFWHMHKHCRFAKLPATRHEFWAAKLRDNVERDQRAIDSLRVRGWRVLVVWECSTRNYTEKSELSEVLASWIESGAVFGEISDPQPS